MATIVLRSIKGSPLTIAEADANFTNLNTEVGQKLDATSYTAADVLTKLLTVDGAGSGLDADTLDGYNTATANTSSTVNYPGFGRIAASSTLTNPYFKIFTSSINPNTATTFTTTSTGTLEAYLAPNGLTGAFIANATVFQVVANSTYSATLTANTLTLTTPLAATSGGTGQNSYTAGDILTAANSSSLSKLGLGTSGYVLQSNGTALVYDVLDGGTF